MKLASFEHQGRRAIGVVDGQEIADIGQADSAIPATMVDFLDMGDLGMALARAAIQKAPRLQLADVRLLAPVQPRKLLALGINYKAHIAEMMERLPDFKPPAVQVWFNKQVTSVAGPYDPMHKPKVSDMFDYEGELAIVIGKRCRHVAAEDAGAVIAGYMICNDASVRDWQMATPTQTMGKSFDTHAPTGPWITTSDEIVDPQDLQVQVWVNEDLRQDFSTADMVFSCYEQIAHLSKAMTLEPGDIIATGTSVGNGVLRVPPVLLVEGDMVKIAITGLGEIKNPVINEPDGALFTR
jgi:2-keto-4-pentenoate hydratase/2-oxohepta-3-ene-1,7-dioic acid hydratase in catechol pathway